MSQSTSQMRHFAERLIAYEAGTNDASRTKTALVFPVIENLRLHLATLMGITGFRALLARALADAEAEVPWLRKVQVKSDGSLEGFDEQAAQVDPENAADGSVALLAQLLGLLAAFIGENLTLHLMREIWPAAPLNGSLSDKSDKNAKAK